MTGSLAVYALQLGCVGTGLALARRRPEHRPLAALMALGLAVDVALELALPFSARVALGTCYPWAGWAAASGVLKDEGPGSLRAPYPDVREAIPSEPQPFTVRMRGRIHRLRSRGWFAPAYRSPPAASQPGNHPSLPAPLDDDEASQPYALASRLAIPLAFALFVCAILATGVRGPALARCYAAAQLVVALGCGLTVWGWKAKRLGGSTSPSLFFRSPGLRARPPGYSNGGGEFGGYASRPLSATTACALVVAFVEMANPWAYLALPSWTSGRAVYAFGFVVVLVVQATALR